MPETQTISTPDEEDLLFRLLRQLDAAPDASQRATAAALGISLGGLNTQLRSAAESGLITISSRSGPDKRQRFAYSLTTRGAVEKMRLTDQFLARKLAEYNALHAELTGAASGLPPLKHRTHPMQSNLAPIPELYVSYESAQKLKVEAAGLTSWDLSPRQICDLELLMNGGFNPLKGFLSEDDYNGVVENMRLADGSLWPMPVTLDVSEDFAGSIEIGQDIALRDQEGVILGTMTVTDRWEPNKSREAEKVFGADDDAHPAVNYLHNQAGKIYLGGPVTGIQQPVHYDFRGRRDTPNELRAYFRKVGWRKVVAFQTRNPLHRAHQELTFRAAKEAQANLLIHPVVGMTKPGDVDHFTRVRCYEAVLDKYPAATTSMSLLNLAMRMAGPREAVWHGLIRANHGCTHFIVGRDHAGPGKNSAGEDFYGPYDAQELYRANQSEIGCEMVDFKHMVYVQERAQYEPNDEIADRDNVTILNISGTELRRRLAEGLEIPEWFSFPEVVKELRRTKPPRSKQGFTVFFTGFSGSGKSTIANALMVKLMEMGGRPVTLLDGDIVRKNLSSELGFSKEHRDLNIRRIGYVASEITKNGGIAICAPIAPYATTRRAVREDVEAFGAFVEVHVATTIEECERRDRKGLYKLAREGKIKEFTGISDPYDVPQNPELSVETENVDVDNCAHQVLLKLESMGLISG
ncbi:MULTISPECIES: bifunctional sulfate adenylyltransferase/adenylylsulfate kinase [unclassified Leisingera]|uniref:bifunctional sulfate adenylyltransferase/adenylylsulfate kinase n=1 Tax=unclassified Leisingera TaxID=2614906 RepID=UPI001010B5FC|nr:MULTISPECIES: bifunctional sulfate adenylyltransferase/adenylylsulfate kinase [unclassified Leisingera]MBQ4824885.1 bifunctional sulfate adenylyltransferase/adenylylsulfate kinase [Leisingera sp. HS039]MCF6432221.1 bifunctional sulfate adenylyltransferase/adenylylsulfate kinase [Leisingera sp. MMG026]QAX28970.1 bifunctional sulfate adenylyltransferase/adenylylsulfate kinase [Leisingera sp. NJS204]QBR37017.1 bifunctional sulfate adenylyltransferase/adenylylsulfate kinase [Leisingera sp. NJS20